MSRVVQRQAYPNLFLNGVQLTRVYDHKHLGIVFSHDMKWGAHNLGERTDLRWPKRPGPMGFRPGGNLLYLCDVTHVWSWSKYWKPEFSHPEAKYESPFSGYQRQSGEIIVCQCLQKGSHFQPGISKVSFELCKSGCIQLENTDPMG